MVVAFHVTEQQKRSISCSVRFPVRHSYSPQRTIIQPVGHLTNQGCIPNLAPHCQATHTRVPTGSSRSALPGTSLRQPLAKLPEIQVGVRAARSLARLPLALLWCRASRTTCCVVGVTYQARSLGAKCDEVGRSRHAWLTHRHAATAQIWSGPKRAGETLPFPPPHYEPRQRLDKTAHDPFPSFPHYGRRVFTTLAAKSASS